MKKDSIFDLYKRENPTAILAPNIPIQPTFNIYFLPAYSINITAITAEPIQTPMTKYSVK